MYISHMFIIGGLQAILPVLKLQGYFSEITTILTICMSLLLIKFIMRPVENLRKKRTSLK